MNIKKYILYLAATVVFSLLSFLGLSSLSHTSLLTTTPGPLKELPEK